MLLKITPQESFRPSIITPFILFSTFTSRSYLVCNQKQFSKFHFKLPLEFFN